ncbi:MAG TPA: carboxypeptidase-like regulatory domain-containing protein, partial [Pyrinomonadaceae bacterium]|nr:carboxypeptidase-like regulatory domain-containing protein [Pyrinomonadaceae bacterium]
MKILQILVLIILLGGFSNFVNAQACGKYRINIKVQNESGEPIDNALVQLLPITKDETRGSKFERNNTDLSNFTLTFLEGQGLSEFHRLKISADGYKTAENELKIVSCDNKTIIVKLAKTSSSNEPVWNFENRIELEAAGENGENLESSWVIVTDGEKIVTQLKMENGYINFMLK